MPKSPKKKESAPEVEAPVTLLAPECRVYEIDEFEQGSPEWFDVRRGVPTASNFHKILAEGDGKTRMRYMRDLAGERVSGAVAEGFKNGYMDRGNLMEESVRAHYERTTFAELKRVAFVRNGKFGCSPDALIMPDKPGRCRRALEIKTMMPALLIEMFETGRQPTEHRAQVQGTMMVCGLDEVDLVIGYTGMPPLKFTFKRDEAYIEKLRQACELFEYELRQMVAKIEKMGPKV